MYFMPHNYYVIAGVKSRKHVWGEEKEKKKRKEKKRKEKQPNNAELKRLVDTLDNS